MKSDLREISFQNFKGMYNYMFEVDISMSHTNALFSDLFCASDFDFSPLSEFGQPWVTD